MSDVAPVREADRIKSLDVTRGFALLGILVVNATFFAAPWQASQDPLLAPLDVNQATMWSWLVMHVFFEFKCITLFSMLFGASIFLVGGDKTDKARGSVLVRRLLWLLVFGLIHALLIWYGDILVVYAICGFIVMLMRAWTPATLIIVGALFYLLAFGVQSLFALTVDFIPASKMSGIQDQLGAIFSPSPEEVARVQAAYQGGIVSALQENFNTWLMIITNSVFGIAVRTVGVMLIGMGLFKSGFLSGRAPIWLYLLSIIAGAASLAVIWQQAMINWALEFEVIHMVARGALANAGLSIFVSIAFASVLILLVKAGVKVLTEPLAAVGRMAFTNYIAQSLIMTTIFWGGRGFGLFGEVDRPTLMGIVGLVWLAQLIWSPLWLAKFQMGPLEWLWRRLSYGKGVSIGKQAPA
jgi:uncharacterized protein